MTVNGGDAVAVILRYGDASIESSLLEITALPDVAAVVVVQVPRASVPQPSPVAAAHTLRLRENRGYGAAANAGLSWARSQHADLALLLTSDAQISASSAQRLLRLVRSGEAVVAGPVLGHRRSDGTVSTTFGGLRSKAGRTTHSTSPPKGLVNDAAWVDGAVMALSLHRCGEFDERYFLYMEDVALCCRVRAEGGRVVVASDSFATQRSGSDIRGVAHGYLHARNRVLLSRSLGRGRLPIVSSALVGVAGAGRLMLRVRRSGLVACLRSARAALAGVRDGVRGTSGPPPQRFLSSSDIELSTKGKGD